MKMSKKNDNGIQSKLDDNVIKFPEPSTSSGAGGEKNVGNEPPTGFYFIPDWDTGDDDSAA